MTRKYYCDISISAQVNRYNFWGVYEPYKYRALESLEGVGFQGKNCFTKMVSNFSEINYGFTKHEKMNRKYYYDILVSDQVNRYNFFGGL